MIYKRNNNHIVFRVDIGEEILTCVKEICKKENIKAGKISGIGASDDFEIGYFDIKNKKYIANKISEKGSFEITSLLGNISVMNNQTYIHAHINLCDNKNNVIGGHLSYAKISATFEGVIDIINIDIQRELDNKLGLNMMKF